MLTSNKQANFSNAWLIPEQARLFDVALGIAAKLAAAFSRHGNRRSIAHLNTVGDHIVRDIGLHGSAIRLVTRGYVTDVSHMSRESVHDADDNDVSSLSAAIRAAALMILLILSLVFMSALVASRPAFAQQLCGDRTAILDKLAGRYSETPRSMGLSADGAVVEVLVSSSGSWTILVSHPNRQTCLTATGEHWETIRETAFGPSA